MALIFLIFNWAAPAFAGSTVKLPEAPASAPAAVAPAIPPPVPVQQTSKPTILFFGGYDSTGDDMQAWESGCRSEYGSQYNFKAYRFLGRAIKEAPALEAAEANIQRAVKLISANPNQEYILVGHSSAGHFPAEIARRLPKGSKIKLVSLDGFEGAAAMQSRYPTVCISRLEPHSNCENRTPFTPVGCNKGSRMCGHFRMVNKNAPADMSGTKGGYVNFSCNLDWLKRFPPARGGGSAPGVTK